MTENEENVSEEIAMNLEEIKERFEDQGFFKRMKIMVSGLSKPHGTRAYKLARLELQRLAAPLIAVTAVSLFVVSLFVITAVSGQKKDKIEITVAKLEDTAQVEDPPPEPEPPPPDPPEQQVEIDIDVPVAGPVSDITTSTPVVAENVTSKPAAVDSVAMIDSPVKMKSMTGSRDPARIGAMTKGGGQYGDPTTEAAVLKILWWLKETQNSDGSWKGKRGANSSISDTGLAILTFLAHGEYPGSPSPYRNEFGPSVQRGIEYLIGKLNRDSKPVRFWGADGNEYAFLIATYALSEAYGMTRNPNCKEAALLCLDRIIKGQSPTGGWDYKINPASRRDDMSFAGWALQALKAGKMAGLHPDGLNECIKKAIVCLQKRNFSRGGFNYTAGGPPTGLTATGCLAMQLLGYGTKPEVRSALDFMKDWKPTFDQNELSARRGLGSSPQYYCYYATQCKYQAGMREGADKAAQKNWIDWNAQMKKLYPKSITELEKKVADSIGQEHKQGFIDCCKDAHTNETMASCLVALQLMVYYRYLPTSQTAAGAVESDESSADAAVDKNSDLKVDVDI